MQTNFNLAIYLAFRDWLFEHTMTLCAVLALASMLMPILVLQGVRNGVIGGMREKLLADPEVLIISPIGGGSEGHYTKEFIEDLKKLPGAAFSIARIREIATDISLQGPQGQLVTVHMEPCGPGEPLLAHHNLSTPKALEIPEIVLSKRAQTKLGVNVGETVRARLGRKNHAGRFESKELRFKLIGILPREVSDRVLGFLPLEVLEDIEDFRDDIAGERRGFTGLTREGERTYASFRLYAKDLDQVENLAKELASQGIETRTKAREIAAIRSLESAINRIIGLLSLAVGAGFVAFMVSTTKSALRRKQRMLGLFRLFGFERWALVIYPLIQTWLTALAGLSLGLLGYLLVGLWIDYVFSEQSSGFELCRLEFFDLGLTAAFVFILASLSAISSALKAASIDPAQVLREV